jgi:ABC-type transporter Mla maintaining outer membrane lipid asymmetry ATPase subunit MlaF
LAARCLLTAALARAIVVRPKLIFFRTIPQFATD